MILLLDINAFSYVYTPKPQSQIQILTIIVKTVNANRPVSNYLKLAYLHLLLMYFSAYRHAQ